jgi:hypothetical protein
VKKESQPCGLWLKMLHSALLVVYLEQLNCTPRALIGAFSVTTEADMKDKQALVSLTK